jgi:long-chain fatty acid transport protein
MQKPIKTIVSTAIAAIIASNAANAGSFSLYTEGSAAAQGNYAAGAAAEAADASTGWYNPAGLPLLHRQQGVFGLVVVDPTATLSGTSTFTSTGYPNYVQAFDGIEGGKVGYVPSLHYVLPLGDRMAFGLSMVSPFGLATSWSPRGPVRYAATDSNLLTFDISPEIGGRVNEHFSVGLGIDFQYARVKFNSMLGSPAQLQRITPFLLDSLSYNRGRSFGVGFHAGAMALFNEEHTRVGLNYQSQLRHRFNGWSRLEGRLANLSPTVNLGTILSANPEAVFWSPTLASNTIILPAITTLSAYQDVNEKIALLGSVVYTGWKSLQSIELDRVAAFAPTQGQLLVNSATAENYRNAWRFSAGANYHVNDRVMLRVGGGYDQTPTVDAFRDIRVPDANRWAASIGAHYQPRPAIGVDIGYTHLFKAGDTRVNKTSVVGTGSTYNVNADVNAHADLFGIQAVWTIDQPAVLVATK